jgi:hypothetical protein
MFFIVGRRLIEAENTSALRGLYTRFLQCFVSTIRSREIASLRPAIGSMETATTTQNAGCTMAVHADCTNGSNRHEIKQLIYKDF